MIHQGHKAVKPSIISEIIKENDLLVRLRLRTGDN